MSEDMTMAGDGLFSGGRHRTCTITKVTNGFRVKLMVVRRRRMRPGVMDMLQGRANEEIESSDMEYAQEEEYVFHTVPEVLDCVKTYLESAKGDLKR